MRLLKGKIAFSILLVCYVIFFLAGFEGAGFQITKQEYAAKEIVEVPLSPWSEASLQAQDAPPMAILLTRLQGIQSYLYLLENERAVNLSTSLSTFSSNVAQRFMQRLYTPYRDLTVEQQKIYSDVLQVVLELEVVMMKVEQATSTPAYDMAS